VTSYSNYLKKGHWKKEQDPDPELGQGSGSGSLPKCHGFGTKSVPKRHVSGTLVTGTTTVSEGNFTFEEKPEVLT
jgi:hypothetical protein